MQEHQPETTVTMSERSSEERPPRQPERAREGGDRGRRSRGGRSRGRRR
jgi:hypothetical protein